MRGDELAARGVIPREPLEPKRQRPLPRLLQRSLDATERLLVHEEVRRSLPLVAEGDEDVAGLDEAVREAGVPRDVDDDRARGLAVEGIGDLGDGEGRGHLLTKQALLQRRTQDPKHNLLSQPTQPEREPFA